MSDRKPEIANESAIRERREFLKKAGKVALTAPAAALLLSAANMPAQASTTSGDLVITNP